MIISVVKPGLYRHYKNLLYEVVGTAKFSEDTSKEFVIYKQLYESISATDGAILPYGTLWARPKEMFTELVEHAGKKIPRFKRIENKL